MSGENERSAQLRHDLAGAVDRDEIVALFQPQYALANRRLVSVETLARWEHPELGTISPAEFIPIAEESDLIGEIGDAMIHLGVAAAAHWEKRVFPIEVAINVSILQLHDPDFVSRVEECIDSTSLDPRRIILELTESTALADVPLAVSASLSLITIGVTLSIDDFGSGYWSEEQVAALPATELKIDQGLVQGAGAPGAEALAAAIDFGRGRGMRTVAEGVETTEQLDRVRELGCDRAQGYLLGRPMSGDELEERLRRG
jgi:EAL domain-containing protein (putative c-di-GMP-specific phosphodiesterase class I)